LKHRIPSPHPRMEIILHAVPAGLGLYQILWDGRKTHPSVISGVELQKEITATIQLLDGTEER
jgi:hypothetical protein